MRYRVRVEVMYLMASAILVLGPVPGLWGCGSNAPQNACADLRCPSGMRCMLIMNSCEATAIAECVNESAVLACEGRMEGAECEISSAETAYCRQGICRAVACGNGYIDEPYEECDECNSNRENGCSASCFWEECGNSKLDPDEECDCGDGDTSAEDPSCNNSSNYDSVGYCNTECELNCGDGEIDLDETCDGSTPTGQYCTDYGYDMGALRCSDTCTMINKDCCIAFNYTVQQLPNDTWRIMGLWGTSMEDIYGVGYVCDETDPFQCWEKGAQGGIFHYDGEIWTNATTIPIPMMDIAGNQHEEVFAVGSIGTILRKDGLSWLPVTHETLPRWRIFYQFTAVHVTDEGHVYIVGLDTSGSERAAFGSVIVERNADGQWTVNEFPEIKFLSDVWSSEGKVFAVGGSLEGGYAAVLHRDDEDWKIKYFPDEYGGLYSVDGTDANNVIAVGDYGHVMHYAQGQWQTVASGNPSLQGLTAARGMDSGKIIIVGRETDALFYDHDSVLPLAEATALTNTSEFRALWAQGENFVAVGTDGRVIRYNPAGQGWSLLAELADLGLDVTPYEQVIKDMWIDEFGEMVVIVEGEGSQMTVYGNIDRQGEWLKHRVSDSEKIINTWSDGPRSIYGIGSSNTLFYWDGHGWTSLSRFDPNVVGKGLWGIRRSDGSLMLCIAGTSGSVFCYDSQKQEWTKKDTGVEFDLNGLWGSSSDNIYAVGDENTILHYDGEAWNRLTIEDDNGSQAFTAVWGRDPANIFVIGQSSEIIHCKWNACKKITVSDEPPSLNRIWGRAPDDAYAAGGRKQLYHYDGITWSRVRFDRNREISAIAGNDGRTLFAIGESIYELRLPSDLCHTAEANSSDSNDNDFSSYQ